MIRVRVLLVLVSVTLLGFAPAPLPKRERQRNDQADVFGTWEFIAWEDYRQPRADAPTTYRLRLTPEVAVIVLIQGNLDLETYALRLEPRASPPAFTWSEHGRVKFHGSYRLEQDKMIIIFDRAATVPRRPTDFDGKPEFLFNLRRIARP